MFPSFLRHKIVRNAKIDQSAKRDPRQIISRKEGLFLKHFTEVIIFIILRIYFAKGFSSPKLRFSKNACYNRPARTATRSGWELRASSRSPSRRKITHRQPFLASHYFATSFDITKHNYIFPLAIIDENFKPVSKTKLKKNKSELLRIQH